MHDWLPPSLTVTEPVGVPAPGAFAPTWTLTVIGWPTTGFEVVLVIAVEVASFATVTPELVDVLEEASLESPL
jgi:hypothetical protein